MKNNGLPRIMTITSGKGGVGKTNISVNLAIQLSQLGYQTCLFDADLGLANVNILLGLTPAFDLQDVILKKRSLSEITIRDFNGIDIIPGSSGVEMMANLDEQRLRHLARAMNEMEDYDFVVLDTSAGISKNVIAFCLASTEVLLVITPEPTSMTDAYALLKVLSLNEFSGAIKVIANQCDKVSAAKGIFQKFRNTVKQYLQMDPSLAGIIIKDPKLVQSVKKRQPHLLLYPDANASKCVKHMAKVLLNQAPDTDRATTIASFWQRCFYLLKNPMNLGKEGVDNSTGKDAQEKEPVVANKHPDGGRRNKAKTAPAVKSDLPTEDREGQLASLMNRLIQHMSSISEELQAIRTVMENGTARDHAPPSPSGAGDMPAQNIMLDFESFLQRRGMK